MPIELRSLSEKEAKKAEVLPAFGALNLFYIKRQVGVLLGLIGRGGIFDEYTRHDISHIDAMLGSLDWLIPDATKKVMSAADWLMIVLSVYFHDLGMLVTPQEYAARNESGFPGFRDECLFAGPDGADYKQKVLLLGGEASERFFYQEFVRHHHAERVRAWILGQAKDHLGVAHAAMDEVSTLLHPLGAQFRRDLALVCESHHLNDLSDLTKYRPSQPYGNSDAETANLQYAAVVLRTADLLHVTSDRTPSVEFRTINPADPISQREWAKQSAVKRVRPKPAINEDGVSDKSAPTDTIEVHAYFTNADGFFGLTSYLLYAAEQLKKSYEWVSFTAKTRRAPHQFPWRKIDDSQIEVEGFIREPFEFVLNQAKILDLLTGHTLYNDTRVVLRELVQNAVDAVRLQHYPRSPGDAGKIHIKWDSKNRVLSVVDNGTGMTQEVIVNHLLRVGTSRYQDPDFRRRYPQFSSISRFGIGVLSAFMIADTVEIITCHPDDERARQLTLRSVHGKYLIRLLDKTDDSINALAPHGTEFRLTVRPSVDMPDVYEAAARWVVVPECEVTVTIDDGPPKRVGFNSPSEALVAALTSKGLVGAAVGTSNAAPAAHEKNAVRILARESDGVSLAYAVRWNEYFREWEFLTIRDLPTEVSESNATGTCIEGIRIEFDSPGFTTEAVLAIANAKGPNAPKTNVARSGIEAGPERDAMLRAIYRMYTEHISTEMVELQEQRAFSMTWASAEARVLSDPLMSDHRRGTPVRPGNQSIFEDALRDLPALLLEDVDRRSTISASDLVRLKEFWTIECGLFRSAEPLIREVTTSASMSQIIRALDLPRFRMPSGVVLCGSGPADPFGAFAFRSREIDTVIIDHEQRRVDVRWVEKLRPPRWLSLSDKAMEIITDYVNRFYTRWRVNGRNLGDLLAVGSHSIDISGGASDVGMKMFGKIYLFPDTPLARYATPYFERATSDRSEANSWALVLLSSIVHECARARRVEAPRDILRRAVAGYESNSRIPAPVSELLDEGTLLELMADAQRRVFDPSAWRRVEFGLDW